MLWDYHNQVSYHHQAALGNCKLSSKAASSFVKEIFGNDEIVVNSIFNRQINVLPI